jgi:hypothetical protein
VLWLFCEALQNNPALVKLKTCPPLQNLPTTCARREKALAALARNCELVELWASVARVVRHGNAPGLQKVVNTLRPSVLRAKICCFFWPQCCVPEDKTRYEDEAMPAVMEASPSNGEEQRNTKRIKIA